MNTETSAWEGLQGLVDSHFHALEMQARGQDVRAVLEACFAEGLDRGLDVAVRLSDLGERRALAGEFPGLLVSAGVHPSELSRYVGASGFDGGALDAELQAAVLDGGVTAVGETGLDLVRPGSPLPVQQEAFALHLNLATKTGKPVIIHNREADGPILETLDRVGYEGPGIMHCFSSGSGFAAACLERGFYISFAGNLTYKKNQALRDLARDLPLNRLLLETDSPYLAPQPVRGQVCTPRHIRYTYACLAEVRGLRPRELVQALAENFQRLFTRAGEA